MDFVINFLFLVCLLPLSSYQVASLPLCTDLRAPLIPKTPLAFCDYNGSSCCDSAKDLKLRRQFEAMNISDQACASAMKSILCATCDKFSAELFKVESNPRPVPTLCNSTNSFCSTLWNTCQNTSILNSPFAPSLQNRAGPPQNSSSSRLIDLWQSRNDFCDVLGGEFSNNSPCFNGEEVEFNRTDAPTLPEGLCLEKIGNGAYLNMVAHPDGSNRAFFSDQPGKIWLATVPEQDSGEALGLDESNPFVDLTDQVHLDTTFGMMGMAFHPNFARNGRFFASYNCDKVKSPGCSGRCACNSDVNCDPSKLGSSSSSSQPCQYHAVIAEFTANGTSSDLSKVENVKPLEVRRIFTMGLPYPSDHGGQILFGPADGYLYFMMGDGGSKGDPYNFAQNKKSILGKIMRLDVNNIPSAEEIADLGLWGNYSIPQDNPYREDRELEPEIWAYGLRNPWRCFFDSDRPSYFMCADVGQDTYEEVDVITKGGNYGWRVYEGPIPFKPQQTPGGNTSADSINPIFPVMGYTHSDVDSKEGSAAISGGYFYRSKTDPCAFGSYLYADLYAKNMWAAVENPENSGNFTKTNVTFGCARDSPVECSSVPNSRLAALGYIFSFGEDNRKDIFVLTNTGVYRVVRPSRCNYTCSKETATPVATSSPPPPSSSGDNHFTQPCVELLFFVSAILVLVSFMF